MRWLLQLRVHQSRVEIPLNDEYSSMSCTEQAMQA